MNSTTLTEATKEGILSFTYLALVLPRLSPREKNDLTLPLYWFKAEGVEPATLEKYARELLSDSVDEEFWFLSAAHFQEWYKKFASLGFDYLAIKHFKPGVTDNPAAAIVKALSLMGLASAGGAVKAASGGLYLSFGKPASVEHNDLTERFQSFALTQNIGEHALDSVLKFPERASEAMLPPEEIDIFLSDDELVRMSKERLLSLSLEEMQAVKAYFENPNLQAARKASGLTKYPTDVELEIIAQTWSEHCKHKIFNALIDFEIEDGANKSKEKIDSLYSTYIKGATRKLKERTDLLSVFEDNAGVVEFDEEHAICFKVETHNSPSALEPYGGALTGILGVNRDILGTGLAARPIFNTDVFCFPHPHSKFVSELKHPRLLPAIDILNGVRKGVQDGGNKSGIPTVNGGIFFHDSYRAKPLVFCGTGGLLPKVAAGLNAVEKYTKVGDHVVMAGGRVGKDGVHGATFSSLALDENAGSEVVQIGDPFTQKRLTDFILKARDLGLLTGITDNGAGGLSSSVGEMARITNGATLCLESVPLKYPGLTDWQIVVSESQERMTISTDKLDELKALAELYDVEMAVVGEFTESGNFIVKRDGKVLAMLDLDFLHKGAPRLSLSAKWQKPESPKVALKCEKPAEQILLELLSSANIASRESVVRQYDHEVQGGSVIKPYMGLKQNTPCDAAVIIPVAGKSRGLTVSCGLNPLMSEYDPYLMAMLSVDEAFRSAVCVGADPKTVSLLDNFCWPDPVLSARNPQGERKLAQLVLTVRGLHDLCLAYKAPLISGKDSMKNDFDDGSLRLSILPTLLVSAIALVPDSEKAVSADFKCEGDVIYLLSASKPSLVASSLGELNALSSAHLPYFKADEAYALYEALFNAIQEDLVASAHDLSEGGLAVALSECCLSGLGAQVHLDGLSELKELNELEILFGEGPARILVSVDPARQSRFEALFAAPGLKTKLSRIGVVKGSSLKLSMAKSSFDIACDSLERHYREPLPFA